MKKKLNPDGDVVHKFKPEPLAKPPRRDLAINNKSQRSDYMKDYMEGYRKDDGKDYQVKPDSIKELRKKQRQRLKKRFNLKNKGEK